jgi:polar amino acid transport system permease protein
MTWQLFGLLLLAATRTVVLSILSLVIGFAISAPLCASAMSRHRLASAVARLLISFFRGVPLLVQLMLIYYLFPTVGLNVPSAVAAVTGMSLCTAAYQAEILRGGFSGVPQGMSEAARMCGLSPFQTFRRITLPIAFKLTLPALTGEAILMLQSSALISVVGVTELTRTAQDLAASTYRPLELYAAAGAIYLALNLALAVIGRGLEKRITWRTQ